MRHASVQATYLGLEDLRGDVACLPGGAFRAVLRVGGVNFAMRDPAGQEQLVAGFGRLLNALDFPIQALVQVRPMDLGPYLAAIEARLPGLPGPVARLAVDHLAHVRAMIAGRRAMRPAIYLVIPADDAAARPAARAARARALRWLLGAPAARGPVDWAAVEASLATRCAEVEARLAPLGLAARRLGWAELAALYCRCWNPGTVGAAALEAELRALDRPAGGVTPAPAAASAGAGLAERARGAIVDRVAPAMLRATPRHCQLERAYVRGLFFEELPAAVEAGWLASLLAADVPLDISLHVAPLDSDAMAREFGRSLERLHAGWARTAEAGALADPRHEGAYAALQQLRGDLVNRRQRVFAVGLYLLLHARSEAELDRAAERLTALLRGRLARVRVPALRAVEALHACLPLGRDALGEARPLPTTALAAFFPFIDPTLAMERGVLLGLAADRSAVILDLFDHAAFRSANGAIIATPGAGKSMTAKILTGRLRCQGVRTIVVDPANEYRRLCAALGGQQIDLHRGTPHRLNPLQLPPPHADEDGRPQDRLLTHIPTLVGLLTAMLAGPGGRLTEERAALLEGAIDRAYAAVGVMRGREATYDREPPLLHDVVAMLQAGGQPEAARMALALERHTTGVQAALFDGPTTIDLDADYVVFNTKHVDAELKPLVMQTIATIVWGQLRPERPTLIVFDEAWELVQHAQGGQFMAALGRTIRKLGGGQVALTQMATDFLRSAEGEAVLGTTAWQLILRQDPVSVREVQRLYHLSEDEVAYLTTCDPGHGLLLVDRNRVLIEVAASPLEYQLATTAPRDLVAQRQPTPTSEASPPQPDPSPVAEPAAWPSPLRPARGRASQDDHHGWRWSSGLVAGSANGATAAPGGGRFAPPAADASDDAGAPDDQAAS